MCFITHVKRDMSSQKLVPRRSNCKSFKKHKNLQLPQEYQEFIRFNKKIIKIKEETHVLNHKQRGRINHNACSFIQYTNKTPTTNNKIKSLQKPPWKLKKMPIFKTTNLPYLCNVDKEQKFLAKQTKAQNNKISI